MGDGGSGGGEGVRVGEGVRGERENVIGSVRVVG